MSVRMSGTILVSKIILRLFRNSINMIYNEALKMTKLFEAENATLEYKREIDTDAIRKTVVAFANANGGTLKIGVGDDGTIIGVNRRGVDRVTQIIRDGSVPKLTPRINIETHEGKDIIVVDIKNQHDIPYSTKNGMYYIRVGATTRHASLLELIDLIVKGPYSGIIAIKIRLPNIHTKIYAGIQYDDKQALTGLSELEQLLMQPMDENTKSKVIAIIGGLLDEFFRSELIFRQMLNLLVAPIPFKIPKPTSQVNIMQQHNVFNDASIPFENDKVFELILSIFSNLFYKITIDSKVTIFTKILMNRIYQFALTCIMAGHVNQTNQIIKLLSTQQNDSQLAQICQKTVQQIREYAEEKDWKKRLALFVMLPAGQH